MTPLALALFTSVQVGPGFTCGRTGVDGEPGAVQCWGSMKTELDDVVELAIGGGHACALQSDGGVSCWGANASGQAGVDGPRHVDTPTRLAWLATRGKVVALSAGGRFTCATLKKGDTTCWGDLRTHPLPPPAPRRAGVGVGVIGGRYRADPPVVVSQTTGPKGLVQHDGGAGFACGVRAKGSVVCWGHIPDDPAGYGFVEQPIDDGVQVAVGDGHACALDRKGAVWCWRSNEAGQLGDGGTEDQQGPVPVVGLPAVVSVSAGSDHTCARTSAGEAWCWGDRSFGAIGDGLAHGAARRATRVESLPPISALHSRRGATCAVPTDPADHPWCWGGGAYAPRRDDRIVPVGRKGVVDVAAGDAHTCARTEDGMLWCWGGREVRGDGRRTDGGVPGQVATQVAGVAAGKNHTCLVDAAGAVACWGDGEFGQLDGRNEGVDRPVQVQGPPLVDLAAGGTATCGRDAEGVVWCWGEGGPRIGARRSNRQDVPTPTIALGPGPLRMGDHHTCTLAAGQLACIGEPWDGALGVAREEEALSPVVAPIDAVRDATIRRARTCAIREDLSLWCWGGWSQDQVEATQVLPEAHAVALAPYGGACAVTDPEGHVACWGDLGPPFTEDGDVLEAPTRLDGVEHVTALVMGEDHTCALHTDGTVTCWGRWRGGKGFGRPWAAREPTTLPLTGVAQLVAGGNHTCARTRDGDVWCWGASDKGQVGHGARARQPKPIQLPLSQVEQLAVGEDHTCARTADATFCWGTNSFGQLGSGNSGVDQATPRPVPLVSGARSIHAGYTSSCATTATGTTCWGRDLHRDLYVFQGEQPFSPPVKGALALGGADVGCVLNADRVVCWGDPMFDALGPDGPGAVDERMGGLEGPAKQVATGNGHTCVLSTAGTVTCFGANHRGQCGVLDAETVPRHTALEGAASVAVGEHHTCAAGHDGLVRCWGDNEHGQLGHGGAGGPEPVVVDGISEATSVVAGWQHTCAVTAAKELHCWGLDDRGQLGRGAPFEAHRPWRLVPPTTLSPRPAEPSK